MMTPVMLCAALLTTGTLAPEGGPGFACEWWTIDAGGGTSIGGLFVLDATIGQPDAGPLEAAVMSGGSFTLTGGYWTTAGAPLDPCPADLNNDGLVNGGDLAQLLGGWGSRGPADLDGNGTVNGADLAIVLGAWGQCP